MQSITLAWHGVATVLRSEPTSEPAVTRNTVEPSVWTSPTVAVTVVSGRVELSQRSATIGPDTVYGWVNTGLVKVAPLICALLSLSVQPEMATMPAVHCAVDREHAPVTGCQGIEVVASDPGAVPSDPSYRLCAPDPDGDAPRYHGWYLVPG